MCVTVCDDEEGRGRTIDDDDAWKLLMMTNAVMIWNRKRKRKGCYDLLYFVVDCGCDGGGDQATCSIGYYI